MRFFPIVFMLLFVSHASHGDRLRLKDGSLLVGTIVKTDDDGLHFQTGFAGLLKIPTDAIETIMTETELLLEQENGDTLAADLVIEDDTILVVSEDDPQSAIPLEDATLYSEEEYARLAEEAALAALPKWEITARAGFAGASGNTNRLAFQGRIDAKRTTPKTRLTSYLEGNFAREEGAQSQNEIFLGANYQRDINPRFSGFIDVNLERDELEELDARIISSVGAGYFAIRRDDIHQWQLNLGVGYRQEFFQDGTSDEEALITAGWEYLIKLGDFLRFTHTFSYLPTITNPLDDFRLLSNARADLPIGNSRAWTLGLGVRNQFDNEPLPGNARLDTIYAFTLNYTF